MHWPRGTRPVRQTEIKLGPGVRAVSPPNVSRRPACSPRLTASIGYQGRFAGKSSAYNGANVGLRFGF